MSARALAGLAALVICACAGDAAPGAPRRHLPLVEVPARAPASGMFAILLTGDGGWSTFDRGLAKALSQRGIPVVGWNSLRYFWDRKSEAEATGDLAAVIDAYAARWKLDKVALLGFSFGADVLPAMAARLPSAQRDRIAMIGLLGPATRYDMEFHFTGWIPGFPDRGAPVLPELDKLRGMRIVCLYGARDTRGLCPDLDTAWVQVRAFPGGHHLGRDYRVLAASLIQY